MASTQQHYNDALLQVSCSDSIDLGDMQQASKVLLHCALQTLQIQRCSLWFYNDNHEQIECFMLAQSDDKFSDDKVILQKKDYPNYFQQLESERTIIANDAQQDPATNEFTPGYLAPLGITSMLDSPIRHRGKMVGIICCEHIGEKRQWTEYEVTFTGSLADIAGRALNAHQRAEAEQALTANNLQLQALLAERENYVQIMEAQLQESERMVSLGNLVSGVAHEVNTPIGVSVTATSHLDLELKNIRHIFAEGKLAKAHLESFLNSCGEVINILQNNLTRATELMRSFKQVAVNQSHLVIEDIHLFDLFSSLTQSLHHETKRKAVHYEIDCSRNIILQSYAGAIYQIFTNLIMNSMKHGFENMAAGECEIEINVSKTDDGNIKIIYQDNGCGIADEHRDKIFERFFTTKRGKGGSGLGMHIVQSLTQKQLQGEVRLLPGADGAGFEFILPEKLKTE
ncbi:MAG: GAF domain-containing sensor histidine kinase [Oceanospirillaceae bacterium]|nr:GAF domain-containing sensor histidine kinase [Oceanospirillaceae bacterium]